MHGRYYCPHFTDEETGTQRLNDLPKVTKLISVQTLLSGLDFLTIALATKCFHLHVCKMEVRVIYCLMLILTILKTNEYKAFCRSSIEIKANILLDINWL